MQLTFIINLKLTLKVNNEVSILFGIEIRCFRAVFSAILFSIGSDPDKKVAFIIEKFGGISAPIGGDPHRWKRLRMGKITLNLRKSYNLSRFWAGLKAFYGYINLRYTKAPFCSWLQNIPLTDYTWSERVGRYEYIRSLTVFPKMGVYVHFLWLAIPTYTEYKTLWERLKGAL